MKAAGPFTEKLWQASLPIFNQIINCEFLKQLTIGHLDKVCFAHFLTQDILYLKKDAEALALLAMRAKSEKEKTFFKSLEKDGLEVESVLQNEYLAYFNLEAAIQQSPAFERYSAFLLDHCQNSAYNLAIIALLPCFWLYSSIKIHNIDQEKDKNPYQKFIDTYVGEEYRQYTKQFLDIVENSRINCENEQLAIEIFKTGMQHELNLFIESIDAEK